jgi:putative acetyltransferase
MSDIIIRGEKSEEIPMATAILQAAYGRDDEARTVLAIRELSEFFHPSLSIVAAVGQEIIGYALYCKTMAGSQPSAYLSMIGVLPDKQRNGAGERLVRHGLERCRGLGLELVFVQNDPAYFSRIGFQPAAAYDIQPEYPHPLGHPLMVIDLAGNLLGKVQGTLRLPPVHNAPTA